MGEDISSEVIAKTQSMLSKHIQKPPLAEKLLRKPPFKFIHDLITSVIRETGFLKGLYTLDELNHENIKDKGSKILFLEKLISAIKLSTGTNIGAHPHKIVAGLEVIKTNELFQTMAEALDKKIDSTKAVEQVLRELNKDTQSNSLKKQQSNSKKESVKAKIKKGAKEVSIKNSSNPNNALKTSKADKKIKGSERQEETKVIHHSEKKKSKTKEPPVSSKKIVNPEKSNLVNEEKTVIGSRESSNNLELQDINRTSSETKVDDVKEPKESLNTISTNDNLKIPKSNIKEEEVKNNSSVEEPMKTDLPIKRPPSAKAGYKKSITREEDKHQTDSNHGDSTVQPKLAEREDKINENLQSQSSVPLSDVNSKEVKSPRAVVRPASARPGAPRIRDRGTTLPNPNDNKIVPEAVNLILDSNDSPKNDEDSLVTVETALPYMVVDKAPDESQLVTGDQGHLVSQIIETKKELEDTTGETANTTNDTNFSWNVSTRKDDSVSREVGKLQSGLQQLTRAVNPLGKLIDFLHEDIDSMQKELENWTTTYHELAKQLKNEEKVTKERMQPLGIQLEDINQLIQEQLEETSMIKAMIIFNDGMINKQLILHSDHQPVPKRL